MKNIFLKITLAGLLFITIVIAGSCSKSFLDRNPTDQLNATTFYSSKDNVDKALAGCYATLQNVLFTWNMPAYDCLADNGYCVDNYYNCTTLSQGPVVPSSGGYISTVYSQSYQNIATYNIFLQTLDNYALADITPQIRSAYQAEVRLLRAMKYFDLYRIYGAVPLVTAPVTLDKQYQPAASAIAILAQINSDIDFAIANLPDIAYQSNVGHLVQSAAQLLKARVLMFDGYNADGTAIASTMAAAEAVLASIVGKNYYSIAPTYRGLFCQDLGQQSNNPEYLFTVNYLASVNYPSSFHNWGVAASYLPQTGTEVWPLPNFANEYEFNDGSAFSISNPLYSSSNVYKNRDPRMAKTIFTGSHTFENGFTTTNYTQTTTGYNYYKEVEGSDAQSIYLNLNGSSYPAMRYAEVLLLYAEAANEAQGPMGIVYSAINQIRNRGDILMPPLPAGLSQTDMRARIRHERRVELAFEGFRFDDLKRWKIAQQTLNLPASESVVSKSFLLKNYHYPLPQTEIDINHGALIQNPDYK